MRQAPTPAALSLPLYVHDGFDLQRFSDYVANRTDFVVQDHHSYFVFTPSDEREPASQHTIDIQGPISDMLAGASQKQRRNLVVDEWSCALTPQSISQEPNKDQARKDFGKGQMDVYTNTTAGWSFWCKYMYYACLSWADSTFLLQPIRKRIVKAIPVGVSRLRSTTLFLRRSSRMTKHRSPTSGNHMFWPPPLQT